MTSYLGEATKIITDNLLTYINILIDEINKQYFDNHTGLPPAILAIKNDDLSYSDAKSDSVITPIIQLKIQSVTVNNRELTTETKEAIIKYKLTFMTNDISNFYFFLDIVNQLDRNTMVIRDYIKYDSNDILIKLSNDISFYENLQYPNKININNVVASLVNLQNEINKDLKPITSICECNEIKVSNVNNVLTQSQEYFKYEANISATLNIINLSNTIH